MYRILTYQQIITIVKQQKSNSKIGDEVNGGGLKP